MSATMCMAPERIAQLVTEGLDETSRAHVLSCATCCALVDDQLEVRKALDRVPAPTLTRSRREAMAAEIMARADLDDAPRPSRRGRWAIAVALVSVAATSVLLLRRPAVTGDAPFVNGPMPGDTLAIRTSRSAVEETPNASAIVVAPARLGGTADYARQAHGERDVVQLRGGELTVDATDARPVQIVSGGTAIAVRKARVKVVASGGAIAQVSVFAGTAEVTVDGRRVIVEAGEVWERPAAEPTTPEAETGAAAFRTGWTALRAGKHADAIAAFDRATDPAVAEDALYWSAVASERASDLDDARRRYQAVIDRFGASPRVVEAKAALARLSAAPAP